MSLPDTHPLKRLEYSQRILKRAQYEAFQFSLIEGDVGVRNASHSDPSAHEYRIRIRNGQPVTCTCPFDTRTSQACKHRVAVAIRPEILRAATTMQQLAEPQLQRDLDY